MILFTLLALATLLTAAVALAAVPADKTARSAPAEALYGRYLELAPQLEHNQFGRALHLDSAQTDATLSGEISAVLNHPFSKLKSVLRLPANWCRLLVLHINIHTCQVELMPAGSELKVGMGQMTASHTDKVYPLEFHYQLAADSADYLDARLSAAQGPISTHNYRLSLIATALGNDKTFLQMTYEYGFGFAGRLAMNAYLATTGRNKVGFTQLPASEDGEVKFIGGMRGLIERNAMRYYLALDAHLASYAVPPEQQFEAGLRAWFDATENYPRQLHELDRSAYLTKKRAEFVAD